jgi:hypothetical protein
MLFLLPLISPLFAASAVETNLPACCRKDGRHHCAMSTMTKSRATSTETIQAAAMREKCPCSPAPLVNAHTDLSRDEARATTFLDIIGLETCVAQTEARYRISFDRSRQKRGPPNQHLSLS